MREPAEVPLCPGIHPWCCAAAVGASNFDLLPGEVWHCGGWCTKDVLLVFEKESINELLHGIYIAIVDWVPCFSNNLINLLGVGGIGAW